MAHAGQTGTQVRPTSHLPPPSQVWTILPLVGGSVSISLCPSVSPCLSQSCLWVSFSPVCVCASLIARSPVSGILSPLSLSLPSSRLFASSVPPRLSASISLWVSEICQVFFLSALCLSLPPPLQSLSLFHFFLSSFPLHNLQTQ